MLDSSGNVLLAKLGAVTGGSFDIHDDVTNSATIVDSDRLAFSDEGTAGDPMRYTTASSLADYMQAEIRISTSVINSGTLSLTRGGTGGNSASAARTSLGLGSIATRDIWTGSQDGLRCADSRRRHAVSYYFMRIRQ